MGAIMRQLSDVDVFVRVVESGSYAAAAKGLDLAVAREPDGHRFGGAAGRSAASPDDAPDLDHPNWADVLRHVFAASGSARERRSERGGGARRCRRHVANLGARALRSALPRRPLARFQATYPGLQAILDYSDRKVDLVAESYDLAIRGGAVENTSLVAKRLWPFRVGVYGSPAYLKAAGRPRNPSELATHRCLLYTGSAQPRHWRLRRG